MTIRTSKNARKISQLVKSIECKAVILKGIPQSHIVNEETVLELLKTANESLKDAIDNIEEWTCF